MNFRQTLAVFATAFVAVGFCYFVPSDAPAGQEGKLPFASVRLRPDARIGASPGQMLRALQGPIPAEPWQPRVNEEKARGVEDVYARVAPATVVVRVPGGHGTGFVIDPDGWILTNRHVIADADVDPATGAQVATVHLGRLDGDFMRLLEEGIPALVYKSSEEKDLALLKLTRLPAGLKTLPTVPLATTPPRPGADCVAVGHPRAGMLWTLRTGTVSGVGKWPEEMIHVVMKRLALTDARDRQHLDEILNGASQMKVLISNCGINPGDSGGPLVNTKGELIGVTFAVPRSEGRVSLDKLAYHVHLDEVKAFVADRPKTPAPYVPDPWPAGVFVSQLDLDGDGVPETLAFGTERDGPPTGILIDLSQSSAAKFTAEQRANLAQSRAWNFEFALHRQPQARAFYDTDGDGKIDLILFDTNGAGTATSVLRLDKGTWVRQEARGQGLLDPLLFTNLSLRQRFSKILQAVK